MALSHRLLASLIGSAGVVLWATETTFITFTTAIPPLQTVALAFVFAAMLAPIGWVVTRQSPMLAFRQRKRVWLLMVGSLVGYHSCIYYATQKAPPAAAALLQGTTPLMIVLGSALLPGERLRWWHLVGAFLGLIGVLLLINTGGEEAQAYDNPVFYLSLVGVAAALWGLYSVVARGLDEVPSSALGVFYAAASLVALGGHFVLESWVTPNLSEWLAIAGLGILPMGLAIYLWDYGIKRGDIQALGSFSYVEPFVGAVLVALFAHGTLGWPILWSGLLIIGGAIVASASLWQIRGVSESTSALAATGRLSASGMVQINLSAAVAPAPITNAAALTEVDGLIEVVLDRLLVATTRPADERSSGELRFLSHTLRSALRLRIALRPPTAVQTQPGLNLVPHAQPEAA